MDLSQKLIELLYKTISDISLWKTVLKEITQLTGASKGIIMLRDKATAELYITQSIYLELDSPLLYGFSAEKTFEYIDHYYQSDPWTAIENVHHPIRPYALSSYYEVSKLKQSAFWPWLESQQISDTVVFELFESSKYWVSINLYFDADDSQVKTACINFLNQYQKILRQYWELGHTFRLSKSSPDGFYYFLEQQNSAAFLVDRHTKVRALNDKARQLVTDGDGLKIKDELLFIKDKLGRAQLRRRICDISNAQYQIDNPPEESFDIDGLSFSCTLLGKGEDLIGLDTALRLLTVESAQVRPTTKPIWETPGLTSRERQLVEVLADGGRVVDFMNQYGIAKSTAHAHWGNVKHKLDVQDRSEIYASHKLFLENNL